MQPGFEIFEQGFPALQEGSQSAIWKENNPSLGERLGQKRIYSCPVEAHQVLKNEWPVLPTTEIGKLLPKKSVEMKFAFRLPRQGLIGQ